MGLPRLSASAATAGPEAMKRLENNLEAGDPDRRCRRFQPRRRTGDLVREPREDRRPICASASSACSTSSASSACLARTSHAGHVLSLPENVDCCRHAMAIDECRALFPLTRLCDDQGGCHRCRSCGSAACIPTWAAATATAR